MWGAVPGMSCLTTEPYWKGGPLMLDQDQARELVGQNAYDSNGDKVGKIGQVFFDDESGRPEFVTVNTGFFGTSESFVPVAEATAQDNGLALPFTKDVIKDAPNVTVEQGHLSRDEERELYRYYEMSYTDMPDESVLADQSGLGGQPVAAPEQDVDDHERGFAATGTHAQGDDALGGTGHDVSGPTTDEAMTRSEERLDVGTRTEETGRARLRKYVVTEEEQVTVPVTKERAVLEREPITDANIGDATEGPAISEEEHEVVLLEERPVVEKRVEPVERVRLGKEQDTDQAQVSEQVRKEQVEVDGTVEDR